jgi:hypothetical protein
MGLRVVLLCLLATLTSTPEVARASNEPDVPLDTLLTMRVDGSVTIDLQGHVAGYQIDTPVPDTLRGTLDHAVAGWRFQPVVLDGKPAVARTKMRITLAARKLDPDHYQVTVDNVVFPGSASSLGIPANSSSAGMYAKSLLPPRYPAELAQVGASARILIAIRANADGQTVDVAAVQGSLLDTRGTPRLMALAMKEFQRAALIAARHWLVGFSRTIDPTDSDDLTASVLVQFTMPNREIDAPGQWLLESRTPLQDIPWEPKAEGNQRVGVSDIAPGELIPTVSDYKLLSDVIGKAL